MTMKSYQGIRHSALKRAIAGATKWWYGEITFDEAYELLKGKDL